MSFLRPANSANEGKIKAEVDLFCRGHFFFHPQEATFSGESDSELCTAVQTWLPSVPVWTSSHIRLPAPSPPSSFTAVCFPSAQMSDQFAPSTAICSLLSGTFHNSIRSSGEQCCCICVARLRPQEDAHANLSPTSRDSSCTPKSSSVYVCTLCPPLSTTGYLCSCRCHRPFRPAVDVPSRPTLTALTSLSTLQGIVSVENRVPSLFCCFCCRFLICVVWNVWLWNVRPRKLRLGICGVRFIDSGTRLWGTGSLSMIMRHSRDSMTTEGSGP